MHLGECLKLSDLLHDNPPFDMDQNYAEMEPEIKYPDLFAEMEPEFEYPDLFAELDDPWEDLTEDYHLAELEFYQKYDFPEDQDFLAEVDTEIMPANDFDEEGELINTTIMPTNDFDEEGELSTAQVEVEAEAEVEALAETELGVGDAPAMPGSHATLEEMSYDALIAYKQDLKNKEKDLKKKREVIDEITAIENVAGTNTNIDSFILNDLRRLKGQWRDYTPTN